MSSEINLGIIAGLLSSFCWAVTTVLMRSQMARIDGLSMNAVRSLIGALFFLVAIVSLNRWGALAGITPTNFWALATSLVFGFVLGDTFFLRSMNLIGVAVAFSISMTYPLYVLLIAWLFLGETITGFMVLGTFIVIAGTVVTASATRSNASSTMRNQRLGLWWAFVTAICFALSTSILKIGVQDVDVIAASLIRLSLATLALFVWRSFNTKTLPFRAYGRRALLILLAAGLIGTGLGSIAYALALQKAGAAIASVTATTAPLFATPLSAIFLKERLTLRLIVGMVLCMMGIWLVTIK